LGLDNQSQVGYHGPTSFFFMDQTSPNSQPSEPGPSTSSPNSTRDGATGIKLIVNASYQRNLEWFGLLNLECRLPEFSQVSLPVSWTRWGIAKLTTIRAGKLWSPLGLALVLGASALQL
jgi:hypothetical protein